MTETTDQTPLTPEQLDEIQARAAAATPGPWHGEHADPNPLHGCVTIGDFGWVCAGERSPAYDQDSDEGHADAEFIAHARTDVPRLAAEVRRLQATQPATVPDSPAGTCGLSAAECQGRWHPEWHIGARGPADTRPDSPAILGRALLDRDGDAWPVEDRAYAERHFGPVREVLLVSPGVARVLEAAQAVVACQSRGHPEWHRVLTELTAAVEAAGDQPAEPTPEGEPTEADIRRLSACQRRRGEWDEGPLHVAAPCPDCGWGPHAHPAAEPTPEPAAGLGGISTAEVDANVPAMAAAVRASGLVVEPAAGTPGDGPGWSRHRIEELISGVPYGHHATETVEWRLTDAEHLRALLADHVRVAAARLREYNRAERAEHEREQIRQELIEVKSDMVARIRERDRYRAERDKALRLVHQRDTEQAAHEGELGDMRAKLAAADTEIDELRELTATCGCCGGNPETYEGPQPDCPVHGAVRAFNEASRELAETRAKLEAVSAERDRLETENDWNRDAAETSQQLLHAASQERDAARAELAEVNAERNRLTAADRETITGLRAELDEALGKLAVVGADRSEALEQVKALRAELATARRALGDIASLAATAPRPAIGSSGEPDRLGEIVRLAQEACRPQSASAGEPAALDAAAHSVWLHGNWRWLTTQMTTEEREAFADAVDRVSAHLNADDPDLNASPTDRWWRAGTRPTPGSPEPAQTGGEGGGDE